MRSNSSSLAHELNLYDRSIALLVICFLFACYMLTYTGTLQSSDGLAMFATTESMVRRGEIDANQILWMDLQQGTFGPDGDLYSRKGMGMSFLALPLVWLAQQWQALGLVQMALLLNPFLTAWTGGLLYRAGIRLGWSHFVAVTTALTFGLATLAWPYTQTFFSDSVAMWGLFGALYGLLAYHQSRQKRYLFLGGAAWGIAYLARSINLITLPIYALALFWLLSPRAIRTPLMAIRYQLSRTLREWIFFGVPIFVAGLLSLWWNWIRYGNPLESGYLPTETFSANWLFGLYGLLIGPARGIVWYSPVLLLAGLGVTWFWRKERWLVVLSAGVALAYLLLYGKWYMWHGGYSWGPRFLVPVIPFVMLLSLPAWHRIYERSQWGRTGKIGAALIVLLSLGVQWLGLLVPFSLVQDWLAANVAPLFAAPTFTRIDYSPLIRQWTHLNPENYHFGWWLAGESGPDWISLGLLLLGVIGGGSLLLQRVRSGDWHQDLPIHWLYAVSLLLVTLVVLTRYQLPLSSLTMTETARAIQTDEQIGDAVLHLRPRQTENFANVYHGRLPVYGLFPGESLSERDQAVLARALERYERLWVVATDGLPEQSGWERPLRQSAFLLQEDSFGLAGQRLALYALPTAQPLTETGAGVTFGEPAWVRLNGYGFTEEAVAGEALLLALEWESLRQVEANYQVFVHLLNEAGERVAQRDGQPQLWLRPTSTWIQGERIVDRYGLLLDDDLPPGTYRILVGLYNPETGIRQSVSARPGRRGRTWAD